MGIFSWFGRTRLPEEPRWMRRWVLRSRGPDDPKLAKLRRAVAEDVAKMEEEDRTYFRHDGPGRDRGW